MKAVIAAFALFLALLGSRAFALEPTVRDLLLFQGKPAVVSSGYTGIGDLSVPGTAFGYWGGDCYTKTGTYNIFKVNDTTTSTTSTVECMSGSYAVASGESLATIEANCTGTACFATYVYDQTQGNHCSSSTNCDLQQTTAGNQPYLVYTTGSNCNGATAGLFCFDYSHGTTDAEQMINTTAAIAQPFSVACVASYASGNVYLFGTESYNVVLNANTDYYSYAGAWTDGGTPSANHWQAYFATFDSAGSPLTQLNNSAPVTTSQGTNTIASGAHLDVGVDANNWTGKIGACFMTTGSDFTTGKVSSMYSNWKGRWGGSMP